MINNSYSLNSNYTNNLPNLDLSIFYEKQSNIEVTENYLKYNKCVYYIDHMSNQNTQTPDLDFNDLATKGLTIMDSLFKSAAPIVKSVSEKMNEFDEIIKNSNKTDVEVKNSNKTDVEVKNINIKYFKNETDNGIFYALDIPRVKKEDCKINISNNSLQIEAFTEVLKDEFNFLPNHKYEITLNLPFNISKSDIIARNSNGVLYITIKKNNTNNVDIKILD
jgi:HSP20 family molecular chaperone IbpA